MRSTEILVCPECPERVEVSPADEDASFGQMLNHIRWGHPETDQRSETLWPRIAVEKVK